MPLSDDQLEQLEAYMDGELPAEQEGALLHRLASEPDLAAALAMVRSERDARNAVWQSYEPSEAAVQRLILKVEHAVDRHNVWASRLSRWRIPTAAAACILIGFMVGWVGRGTTPTDPSAPGGANLVFDNKPRTVQPFDNPRNVPGGGLTTVVNRPGAPAAAPSRVVQLPIVDEYGKQVGVQTFASEEEAAKFLDDINRWNRTQERVKSGNFTLTGEEKF